MTFVKRKILLIGSSPLPLSLKGIRYAAGLRTNQFALALLQSGHEVKLITINSSEFLKSEDDDEMKKFKEEYGLKSDVFSYQDILKTDTSMQEKLQDIHDNFEADIIIGVNTHPAYVACKLKTNLPIWADLNGWVMAEAQAQAYKLDSNAYIANALDMETTVIQRADKMSVVSSYQAAAVLGELALYKRLVKETFDYDFLYVIRNATTWFLGERELLQADTEASKLINPEVFNIFWLGGYNTWVDEVTLFKALELVMSEVVDIEFISTGGGIKGLDEKTFANFMKLVEKSKFKDRFKFLGWVDNQDIPSIYEKVSVGINVDKDCVETFTGARNRINEMLKFGLPVITTIGTEISIETASHGVSIGVKQGDAAELAAKILYLYDLWQIQDEVDDFEQLSEMAEDFIEGHCSYEVTCYGLLKYLQSDEIKRSPDFKIKVSETKFNLEALKNYYKTNGFKKTLLKIWQKVKG